MAARYPDSAADTEEQVAAAVAAHAADTTGVHGFADTSVLATDAEVAAAVAAHDAATSVHGVDTTALATDAELAAAVAAHAALTTPHDLVSRLAAKQSVSEKGQANGYAALDADGLVLDGNGDPVAAGSGGSGGVLLPVARYVPVVMSVNEWTVATKDREYCFGFLLAAQTIDRISFRTGNTDPDDAAVVRIGVRVDADGSPGAPVVDVPVTTATAATWYSATMDYDHPGGVLWVSWVSQAWATVGPDIDNTTPAGAVVPSVAAASLATLDFAPGHSVGVGYQDGVTGALPASFTNTANTSQRLPSFAMRRSA